MNLLSVEDVILINEEIIGRNGLRDRSVLESAVARPLASAFGSDAYPTILEKIAALAHSLILNHPFVDGNKRTATAATIISLNRNGLEETWTEADAHRFIVEIAEGKHAVAAIAQWLEKNTTTR